MLMSPPIPPAPALFLRRRTAWMFSRNTPRVIVTPDSSLLSSSSFLDRKARENSRNQPSKTEE